MVLECVPSELASELTLQVGIPTIGIGAGVQTDGQVLVLQDLLGMSDEFKPKFLKHYLEGHKLIRQAVDDYHRQVLNQEFPSIQESYFYASHHDKQLNQASL